MKQGVDDYFAASGTVRGLERYMEDGLRDDLREVGISLAEVEAQKIEWLWAGRISLGKLTVIDGDPGNGKSAMTIDLAARVSAGLSMPDGQVCEPSGVIILNAEDGLADTIKPRLEAAGTDVKRVQSLATVPDGKGFERLLTIPKDLDVLRRGIEQVRAKLVVVDPLMAFLSGDVDSHRDQDVRRALAPLAMLAEESGAAVLIVRHLNKATGSNALYRGGGSIGIIGAARSAMLVAKHPEDAKRRVLANLKSNLAKPTLSLAFTLAEAENGAVRVEWKGETPLDATALLAAPADEDTRHEIVTLRTAVCKLLEENGGSWEETPTELCGTLGDIDLAAVPERPDELTKKLKAVSRTSQVFTVSQSRKRAKDKVVRTLKLECCEQRTVEPSNGVHGGNGVHNSPFSVEGVNSVNAVNASHGVEDGVHVGRCVHDVLGGCWLCNREGVA